MYGGCYSYAGENPFLPTDLKMGILDIAVTSVEVRDGDTYIYGQNFTPFSRVYVDGFSRSCSFLDEGTLVLEGYDVDEGDKIRVAQVADGLFQLSSAPTYVVP